MARNLAACSAAALNVAVHFSFHVDPEMPIFFNFLLVVYNKWLDN